MNDWAATEAHGVEFGDERLDARYRTLLTQLGAKPSLSIPAACGSAAQAQAAYRFFDNDKVTPEKVLQPHRAATLARIRAAAVVVAAQDTTELDLTRKQEAVGGPLNDDSRWGLYLHPVLVVTPQRVPLGVVDAAMWSRDPAELAKSSKQRRKERRAKPFEAKESYRWLHGYEAACRIAEEAPDTQVVSVSDSEGDIYECFLAGTADAGRRADGIVRGCQDRTLADGDGHLRQLLACRAPLGKMTVAVSRRDATTGDGRKRRCAREARTATVTVRAVRTLLDPPDRRGTKLPPVYVNAILVREEHPPPGEEPIEWLLLTSLPIETFAEVGTAIGYYCCRWEIEVYFRVLKSGCKIEALQLEREDRLQACLAVYLVVAWRVLYALKLGRDSPEIRCTVVFSEAEWKSAYAVARRTAVPETPPTLGVMIPLIAALGGYLGRANDGPPGPKAMWIGLQRLSDLAIAWTTFGPKPAKTCA